MRRYQQISRTRIADIFKEFVERGSVRRKSLESEWCLHVRGQQESMYNGSKACAVRQRCQEAEEERGSQSVPRAIVLPGTTQLE